MGRERVEYKRTGFKREYKKLFIIATEGEKTEKVYFSNLFDSELVNSNSYYIEILPASDGKSSPRNVIKRLDKFKEKYKLYQEDELWMLIDRDSWDAKQLNEIARECSQKSYNLAVSTPCFELWLLLHKKDVSMLSRDEKQKLLDNKKVNKNRTYIETQIIEEFGTYNKSMPNCSLFLPHINTAVSNSIKLITNPKARWSEKLSTYVYKLVVKLLKKPTSEINRTI
ncbi:MAG: RloB family protein [Ignavibacteriaceae bacterium]|nr:RloB family protein [Ignavibacteriaceae bacterium]